jgi:hypothetical protein
MKPTFNQLRSRVRSGASSACSKEKAQGHGSELTYWARDRSLMSRHGVWAVLLLLVAVTNATAAVPVRISRGGVNGTVTDALGRPLPSVSVELQSASGTAVAHSETNRVGRFYFPFSNGGPYALVAHKHGFKPATRLILLPAITAPVALVLEAEAALNVPVKASRLRAQNGLSRTGNSKYTMTAEDINNLPAGKATPLNDVLLQMPGVALDQNQEIHVRGEHAGIQYQMNNIMLPLNLNNDPTFIQLLNSYFVGSVSLIDGVLPARYGYRTSGVVEIQTKNGCDGGNNNFSLYGGMYDTAERVSSCRAATADSATT